MTSEHDKTCPECKGEGETWSVAGRRYKCQRCNGTGKAGPAEPSKPKSITQRIWDECVAERQGAKKKCIELGNYIRAELSLDETDWAALVDILMEKYDDGYILFPA